MHNGCDNIRLAPVNPTVVQATCVGGVVMPPTVTPAAVDGNQLHGRFRPVRMTARRRRR